MQHEFNSRIAAQRTILQIVNRKTWLREQLFGLSSKAIDRWTAVNGIDADSRIAAQLRELAAKLFFLANKSQEQVSSEYMTVSAEIVIACQALQSEIDAASV